jgi:undecaprenyl-diphosphatase
VSLLDAFLLGLVQGLTEFLPVSSSGHLVVFQSLLDIRVPGVAFEVAVHLATLLSILVALRSRVAGLVAGMVRLEPESWRYSGLLALATVPAAVVGVGAGEVVEGLFDAPAVAGFGLLVTGSFLWTSRAALSRSPAGRPGWKEAVLMGLAQALAIIPGISRSGATVIAGLWLGLAPEEAAAFSFLMAVPAIAGAAVLKLPELMGGGGLGPEPLLVGGVVAGLAGVLAIRTFLRMLKNQSFHRFGPYCLGVGFLFLLFLALRP